jgi:signal transduction histidine kinase
VAKVIGVLAADIYLLSGVTAVVFSAIIFTSLQGHSGRASVKGSSADLWAKLFAAASALWGVMYAMRYAVAIATENKWVDDASLVTLKSAMGVVVQGSSSANNLLFLGAARLLMRRKPTLPGWVSVVALVSLVGMLGYNDEETYRRYPVLAYVRFPDVLFSVYCLVYLGWAIAVHIAKSALSYALKAFWFIAGTSIFYAALHVIYAFSLFLSDDTRKLLEPFLFALSLPPKFVLFFAAYLLLMRNLTTFESLRDTLVQVTHGRHEFLSPHGILRPVGLKIGADKVDLSIRLPGRQREYIASLKWECGGDDAAPQTAKTLDEEVKRLPLAEADELIRDCLRYGVKDDPGFEKDRDSSDPKIIPIPVFFHGAVIGCLKVERWRKEGFSAGLVQQAREFVGLMSPTLQSFRELAALDRLSIRLANKKARMADLENTREAAPTGAVRRHRDVTAFRPIHFVKYMADIVNDTLSPNASRLFIKAGFNEFDPVFVWSDHNKVIETEDNRLVKIEFERQVGRHEFNNPSEVFAKGFYYNKIHYATPGVELRKKERATPHEHEGAPKEGYLLGDLIFAVPSEAGDSYPALGTRLLHRKVVSTIAADAYLDFMRGYFEKLLNRFSRRLNREIIQQSKWSRYVHLHAQQAGLLWAVAARRGHPDLITWKQMPGVQELVKALREGGGDPKELEQCSCDEIKAGLKDRDQMVEDTCHVIGIPLQNSEHCLWFGVARRGFGDELKFMSPWKAFLENFARIADAALQRYATAKSFQRLQIDAARANELAAVAATTGTVIHQLTNMARDQRVASSVLVDGLKVGGLNAGPEYINIINSMERGAAEQLSLLGDLLHHTEVDGSQPSSLFEAAEQASHLFSTALLQGGIKLEKKIPRDLLVDVPFYVASLALSNLISNAKDAITQAGRAGRTGGVITISAEADGDFTLCHVTDDGIGIPHHLRDRVFESGATTKGQNGGWGLFLVHHSLKEHGSLIYVNRTGPEGTTFTIRFPNPR